MRRRLHPGGSGFVKFPLFEKENTQKFLIKLNAPSGFHTVVLMQEIQVTVCQKLPCRSQDSLNQKFTILRATWRKVTVKKGRRGSSPRTKFFLQTPQ